MAEQVSSFLRGGPSVEDVYIFDADDTLWLNEWQYSLAIFRFCSYLHRIFKGKVPNINRLIASYFRIDSELGKSWGVRRGRVALCMTRVYRDVSEAVYRRFCFGFSQEERVKHEEKIAKIGDSPFDYTKLRWLPEAREVLTALKTNGVTLGLLTSYDNSVFPARAEFMKISEFFDDAHVLAVENRKTKEDFIKVSGWTSENDGAHRWFAVGNSRTDIDPALSISSNWYGIFVPHASSSPITEKEVTYDNFDLPAHESPRVVTVSSLVDFWDALSEIDNRIVQNQASA